MADRTELCLFLSSTFLDMKPEREYLVKHLFPELRQVCRERGVILTEIDLRWGITERQGRRGKIVTACLEEILRRRPFILAFVGDRYGWCPVADDLNNTSFLNRFPWIEQGVNEGKSLVELETLEVARNEPAMRERIHFYFKRKNYAAGPKGKANRESISADVEELHRLDAFHRRVREAGLPLREGYHSPAQLGEWIREDVLAILESIAPGGRGVDSWIARERYGHEAYAATRRRAYIDHDPTLQMLDSYVAADGGDSRILPLVVTGESGAGKSALLARWSERYRERSPDTFLIEHYVGATSSSADQFALMRRIMAEIRERYELSDDLPALPEQIVEAFPAWLARIREERLVLVVDALDRLEHSLLALSAFPQDYSPHVRLIVSTTPGPVFEQIRERGWKSLAVHPLAQKDRGRAIRAYLAEFSKRLEPDQVRRIAADSKSANPLYLRTSLEELRIHGEHETLNSQIEHYLSAADPGTLFGLVLERIENDFGKVLTASAMCCLWASRSGLSEAELAALLKVSRQKLRPLVDGMEYHLTRIDGRLNFCHDHLRQAVRERYLPSRTRRRNAHRRLGAYFAQLPSSPRRAEEEPWQWQRGEEWNELQKCLTDPEIFPHLNTNHSKYSLLQFWRGMGEEVKIEDAYRARLEEYEKSEPNRETCATLWKDSGEFLMLTGNYEGAIRLLRHGKRIAESIGHPLFKISFLGSLGRGLIESGEYQEAETLLREALLMYRDVGHSDTCEYADILAQLGSLYYYWRRYNEAETTLNEALEIRNKLGRREEPETAKIAGVLAAVLCDQRKFDKAEPLWRYELSVLEKNRGASHPDVGTCMNNLGAMFARMEQHERGVEYFEKAYHIYEQTFGPKHPSTGRALTNLSYVFQRIERNEEAEQLLIRAIDIDRQALGDNHPAIAQKLTNLGTLLKKRGEPVEAEQRYREALQIRSQLFGPDHVNTAIAWLNVAAALKEQQKSDEAVVLYREHLLQKMVGLGMEHPDSQLSLGEYRELLAEAGTDVGLDELLGGILA